MTPPLPRSPSYSPSRSTSVRVTQSGIGPIGNTAPVSDAGIRLNRSNMLDAALWMDLTGT